MTSPGISILPEYSVGHPACTLEQLCDLMSLHFLSVGPGSQGEGPQIDPHLCSLSRQHRTPTQCTVPWCAAWKPSLREMPA